MRPADQIEEVVRSATDTLEHERTRHHRASITAAQAWREPMPSDNDPRDDADGREPDAKNPDEDGEDTRRRPILDSEP